MNRFILICLLLLLSLSISYAAKVTFKTQSLTVWARNQLVEGRVDTIITSDALLYLNGKAITFQVSAADSSFSVPVKLSDGTNRIFVQLINGNAKSNSDTLSLILGYKLRPEVYAYASVNGRSITLNSQVIENPDSSALTYTWNEDVNNPVTGLISNVSGTTASFTIPLGAKIGEYYYNLTVAGSNGDTAKFRTYVTVDSSIIKPFNIKTDHAAWIDKAVIYEVTPYNFVYQGKYNNITQKLPDLIQLGITTLWIQPVYQTHGGGQGYDVTDYFSLRPDLGSEADLQNLIKTAKSLGMKVLFDFVANHTSIYHPYAQHSIKYGINSHYWNYYQRQKSPAGTPYSQYENNNGNPLFINYFWDQLPNLNFDNPEVQRWIIEATKYWIEKYDIDGYRFDAIWGVNARKPDFTKQLRLYLKRLKPDILMLAEDKATWPAVFDERFDMAFDWTATQDWVSQWVWQTAYDASSTDNNRTIFNNAPENNRANRLKATLTNNGAGYAANAKILRFLENNDTQHFINHHGIDRTKMAAVLEFSLPGVPMIYNGQEIGKVLPHPYNTGGIFFSDRSIPSQDQGMFQYYKKLAQLKRGVPALYSNTFEETSVDDPSGAIYAYRRWSDKQNVFVVTNMASASSNTTLTIPVSKLNLDSAKTYYMTDMLNGTVQSGKLADFASVKVSLNAYNTKMFLLADTAMTVVGVEPPVASSIPEKFDIEQNYPNPFNPSTVIKYSLPQAGKITLKVYDILGKEIATLVDGFNNAGSYSVKFDGQAFASGIYIYNVQFNGQSIAKKMVLAK